MGVKGLAKYVAQHNCGNWEVPIPGSLLVVDGNGFVYHMLSLMKDCNYFNFSYDEYRKGSISRSSF